MGNEQETKVITTPSGKEVVLKAWITGRDKRSIQSIYADNMVIGEDNKISGIKAATINEAKDKTIELVVISVGGSSENILDAVLDLPSKDTDFIMNEIDIITSDEDTKKE